MILRKRFSNLWIHSCFRNLKGIVLVFWPSPNWFEIIYMYAYVLWFMNELRAWGTWIPLLVWFSQFSYDIDCFECILKSIIWSILINATNWFMVLNSKERVVHIDKCWKYSYSEKSCLVCKDYMTTTCSWKGWEFLHSFDLCFHNMKSLILIACLDGLNYALMKESCMMHYVFEKGLACVGVMTPTQIIPCKFRTK